MKKLVLAICMIFVLLSGCKQEPHWSYKACLEAITRNLPAYSYTVKEIEHNEHNEKYDEVHCFDITITYGDRSKRYCCFAVIIDGKVSFVDCDLWGG